MAAFLKKNQNRASSAINKPPPRNPTKASKMEVDFTLFKIFFDHVFSAIKDQPWVRHPKPLPANPKRARAEKYYAFLD